MVYIEIVCKCERLKINHVLPIISYQYGETQIERERYLDAERVSREALKSYGPGARIHGGGNQEKPSTTLFSSPTLDA